MVGSGPSTCMLSKKVLISDELETLRRSRNATVVMTANGEAQTNEEAQVYVHDIGRFVTLQLLEDTPAVPSLGKLCEDHGYSYKWQTGQRPQLTKQGKNFFCRTDNFVLFLFFQVCLPVLVLLRLQKLTVQDLSSSSSATERSGEVAPGNWCEAHQITQNQNKKKDDNRDSDERLRDLPDWLEEFTHNLENTEMFVPAHISQDSDSEYPTRVV